MGTRKNITGNYDQADYVGDLVEGKSISAGTKYVTIESSHTYLSPVAANI